MQCKGRSRRRTTSADPRPCDGNIDLAAVRVGLCNSRNCTEETVGILPRETAPADFGSSPPRVTGLEQVRPQWFSAATWIGMEVLDLVTGISPQARRTLLRDKRLTWR